MKNKGRKQITKEGNCKSLIYHLTRPMESMSSNGYANGSFDKKKWIKRMRGYLKTTAVKKILGGEDL